MIARAAGQHRPGALSIALIAASILASAAISLAMDLVLIGSSNTPPIQILASAMLFNSTVVLQSVVGGIIEWQRPGHTIGRLLMLSGPLYALLAAGWLTGSTLDAVVDPGVYRVVNWAGSILSWPGVALIAGWVPLLFPTGTLPGPRWRIPASVLVVVFVIGLVALALRPGPLNDGTGLGSPIAIDGWPPFLQPFVDAIPLDLLALLALAVAALVVRYRRGDRVERLQVRWFAAAVALCGVGFVATAFQAAIRTDDGPLLASLIAYAGILAMPIAIGIAVTRYRLYELDRLISRTIGWGLLTLSVGAIFAVLVVALQAVLSPFTSGSTLAVAASTLVAAAVFQPARSRIQVAVDQRFNRSRYDAQKTAAGFAGRLQNEVDLSLLGAALVATADLAVHPVRATVWLRSRPEIRL